MTSYIPTCTRCGTVLVDASVVSALQINALERGGGELHQMVFGWVCLARCAYEVMDAIRAVADDFELGPVNMDLNPVIETPPDHVKPAVEYRDDVPEESRV